MPGQVACHVKIGGGQSVLAIPEDPDVNMSPGVILQIQNMNPYHQCLQELLT